MWVSSNHYFLLIIYFVKDKNKFCCIIISYCELKLKVEDIIRPGKIMHIRGINYNIIISHPSYSSVYQDEAKMRSLKDINFCLALVPNQKNDKTVVHIYSPTVGFFNFPTEFLKGCWV